MDLLSDAELTDALIKELCSGRKFMEENCKFRETEAAKEAEAARGHKTHPTLGKKLLTLPAHDYFTIRKTLGDDFFHTREGIREFQRMAPEFSTFKT